MCMSRVKRVKDFSEAFRVLAKEFDIELKRDGNVCVVWISGSSFNNRAFQIVSPEDYEAVERALDDRKRQ